MCTLLGFRTYCGAVNGWFGLQCLEYWGGKFALLYDAFFSFYVCRFQVEGIVALMIGGTCAYL